MINDQSLWGRLINLLSDILTYIRRIIKSYTNGEINDNLLIDYVNRFYINDVDARVQLFDLKTKYEFSTTPAVDKYNMPLYDVQTITNNFSVNPYPVYQGFFGPCYIDGYLTSFFTDIGDFRQVFWDYDTVDEVVAQGDGVTQTFTLNFPTVGTNSTPVNPPVNGILRGHVDISGIIATGNNVDPPEVSNFDTSIPVTSVDSQVWITTRDNTNASMVIKDSGQILDTNKNFGLLMNPGNAQDGNASLGTYSATSNVVDYLNGVAYVTFPSPPADGANINVRFKYFQSGRPRGILYHNNVITLRQPPADRYVVELQAYLTPAAFLTTSNAVPFGYMSEYIARGAARKILSDTGDIEQFNFYEPLFREQEKLVLARSTRQKTATRVQTIYSAGSAPQGTFGTYWGNQT